MVASRTWVGVAVVAAVVAAGQVPSARAGAKRRVVYFTQTQGFRHGTILPLGLKVLKELGAKDEAFEVELCEDGRKWSREYLGRYDAMVSFGSGELPLSEASKQALLDFVRGGKGFVAIHSACYMCPRSQWKGYTEMLGGAFINHPWNQKVGVIVEDRKHPATAHLGEAFEIRDEIYQMGQWSRAKTHVLLSLDNRSVDVTRPQVRRKDKDFALAWCHRYGQGRVLYTAFGHYAHVWNDPRFQTHLRRAVLWAMGDLAGDAPLGSDGRPRH